MNSENAMMYRTAMKFESWRNDASGVVTTINSAASRLLTLDRAVVGSPARSVFHRADLQPLGALLSGAGGARAESAVQEIPVLRDGQELQAVLPAFAAWQNPVDLTTHVYQDFSLVPRAVQILAADPAVDLIAFAFTSRTGDADRRIAEGLVELAAKSGADRGINPSMLPKIDGKPDGG